MKDCTNAHLWLEDKLDKMITEAKEGEESKRTRKTLASSSCMLWWVFGIEMHPAAVQQQSTQMRLFQLMKWSAVTPLTHILAHTSETHTDKPHLLIYQRESHSNQGGPKSLKHNKTDLVLIKPKHNHRFPLSHVHTDAIISLVFLLSIFSAQQFHHYSHLSL